MRYAHVSGSSAVLRSIYRASRAPRAPRAIRTHCTWLGYLRDMRSATAPAPPLLRPCVRRAPLPVCAVSAGSAAELGRRCVLSSLLLVCAPALAAEESLSERVAARRLNKTIFNIRPSVQTYPAFLEGVWNCELSFSGYAFPSKISKEALVADSSVPGFLRLSIAALPDVGKGGKFQLRFLRSADGTVVADVAANAASVVDGVLGKQAVESVEVPDVNRLTIRLLPGVERNAERLECYVNARESEERADGTFFALEQVRQVSLGYSTQFNAPRVAVTDWETVWTYTQAGPDAVEASIVTAGYIQPNEALKYTSSGAVNGRLEPPKLDGLVLAATEPVVLYSHKVTMRRAS